MWNACSLKKCVNYWTKCEVFAWWVLSRGCECHCCDENDVDCY
jgi:hypothetical protein